MKIKKTARYCTGILVDESGNQVYVKKPDDAAEELAAKFKAAGCYAGLYHSDVGDYIWIELPKQHFPVYHGYWLFGEGVVVAYTTVFAGYSSYISGLKLIKADELEFDF